jgi:hypothetical protein
MRIGIGAVHGSMAIRTTGDKGLGIMRGTGLCDGMTVDARSGLSRGEQIVGSGTMRNVAVAAILLNRRVIVDPGACLSLVAYRALVGLCAESSLLGFMRRMTVHTAKHPLSDRVMGGKIQSRSHLRVAIHAEPRFGSRVGQNIACEVRGNTYVARLAIMWVMAVRTEQACALVLGKLPTQ